MYFFIGNSCVFMDITSTAHRGQSAYRLAPGFIIRLAYKNPTVWYPPKRRYLWRHYKYILGSHDEGVFLPAIATGVSVSDITLLTSARPHSLRAAAVSSSIHTILTTDVTYHICMLEYNNIYTHNSGSAVRFPPGLTGPSVYNIYTHTG